MDLSQRNVLDAKNALEPEFVYFASGVGGVPSAAITAAGNLKLSSIGEALEKVTLNRESRVEERVASLLSLAKLNYDRMGEVLTELESGFSKLPAELGGPVIRLLADVDEDRTIDLIKATLASGQHDAKVHPLVFHILELPLELFEELLRAFACAHHPQSAVCVSGDRLRC